MSVELSLKGALAEIVLNRPDKMNALNDAMVAELNRCLDRAERERARAILIRGVRTGILRRPRFGRRSSG